MIGGLFEVQLARHPEANDPEHQCHDRDRDHQPSYREPHARDLHCVGLPKRRDRFSKDSSARWA
jgi:hypothetical protein